MPFPMRIYGDGHGGWLFAMWLYSRLLATWQHKSETDDVRLSLKAFHSPLHRENRHYIRFRRVLLNTMGRLGLIFQLRCWAMSVSDEGLHRSEGEKVSPVSKVGVEPKDTFLVILNILSWHCTPYLYHNKEWTNIIIRVYYVYQV